MGEKVMGEKVMGERVMGERVMGEKVMGERVMGGENNFWGMGGWGYFCACYSAKFVIQYAFLIWTMRVSTMLSGHGRGISAFQFSNCWINCP
jgi:hypothetical protein